MTDKEGLKIGYAINLYQYHFVLIIEMKQQVKNWSNSQYDLTID